MCTNEPEICGFITNDLSGKKMSIQKCDKCNDGFLIIKRSSNGEKQPFLGCTNFTRDGKGCSNSQTMQTYYSMYGLKDKDPDKTYSWLKPSNGEEKVKNPVPDSKDILSNHRRTIDVPTDASSIQQNKASITNDFHYMKPITAEGAAADSHKSGVETIYFNGVT